MQLIQWAKDHWDAILACQQALFVFLSLLFELLGKTQASKWFGTYATVDAGRLVRNAKVKAAIVNGSLLIGLLLCGCSLSLEQARADGIRHRVQTVPVVALASRTECDSLDKTQRYWGYAGYATGPVSPLAAGLAAVPGISDKDEGALLATAAVAAAVTVFEFAEQGNFAQQWAAQGCGQ
jgi:hypothetical protein